MQDYFNQGLFTLRLTPGYLRSKQPLLTPGKGTFHTCNLKAVLAPHFTRGYETLLRSRVSTAFVVLTPHCGAKFVQCETEQCLFVAAGRLATDSQSEMSSETRVVLTAASEKKYQKKRWKE